MNKEKQGDRLAITFMSGPLDGKTLSWKIPAATGEMVLNIGRKDGCDIMLDYDSQVSRVHAKLTYEMSTKHFTLEDLDSRNGTFINTSEETDRILAKTRTRVQRGQLFKIGRTWMRIDSNKPLGEVPHALMSILIEDDDDNDSDLNF